MSDLLISRSWFDTGSWGQKLGQWAKSKENLNNTRGHIFEAIVMSLVQTVCHGDLGQV